MFRPTAARVGAWVWLVFAAFNLADIAWRGRNLASLIAAAVILFLCGLAYVLGLRPRIAADDTALELRNPLRDVRVPWPALRGIEADHALDVRFTVAGGADRTARAWVLQTSPRARAREERRFRKEARHLPPEVAAKAAGRTALGYAAEQLNELAARRRRAPGDGTGTVAWSIPAIAALAVPGVLLVVTVALGFLR
ncbi:PH domain-containing protein [Thermomonospora echinospora]|uniref:PH domain-containing protein n=1 Tax=Thermomonospora echinospora TaxID=1992 RepID=A0A1H5ZI03_9ACTN|nr:PH domain-containing protein [Thermomonospora echinospora]SEG35750.1 PH domain-containing protein [Thermomonospora echinospora]